MAKLFKLSFQLKVFFRVQGAEIIYIESLISILGLDLHQSLESGLLVQAPLLNSGWYSILCFHFNPLTPMGSPFDE